MSPQNSGLEALATFISTLENDDIPAELSRTAERCFVDTVGVALPGAAQGAGRTATGMVAATGDTGPATLFSDGSTASVADAALANGTACHGLDFDDVSDAMSGHPSTTMVPALLAAGESVDASGEDLLTAFVAGFEAQAFLSQPILPSHYEIGWHSTSTNGTLGSAAAVAALLDLDAESARTALNVAASGAAGLKRNFGSMTKPMHGGQAARAGVTAALLARDGFTADENAIEGEHGFYGLYADVEPQLDRRQALGEEWALDRFGVDVKKFPCCYFTHTSIEAASRLADAHDIAPKDVESVNVMVSPGAADALHHSDPQTGLEAKFSIEYTVACGVARDSVGLTAFEDENVRDSDVQRVRERVHSHTNDGLPYDSHRTRVVIATTDGGQYEHELEQPSGTHDNPLSDAELKEKFLRCADYAGVSNADGFYETLNSLGSQSVSAITAYL